MKLYKSNVMSVLLYSSECWGVAQKDMDKSDTFHNSCLWRICKIYWLQKISNEYLYKKMDVRSGGQDGLKEFKKLAEGQAQDHQAEDSDGRDGKNFNGVNEVLKPKTLSSEKNILQPYLPPGIVFSSRLSQCKHSLKQTKPCMCVVPL